MSFEFEEGQTTNYVTKRAPKGIVGFLIKNKIAKDTGQANIIMIGMIIVLGIIMVIALSGGSANDDFEAYPDIDAETGLPL